MSREPLKNYFGRLKECIRALGVRNGFRYWKLQNLALREPEHALHWAAIAEEQADLHDGTDDTFAWCLRDWAGKLKEHHGRWMTIERWND